MGFGDRVLLTDTLSRKMGSELTVEQLNKVMEIVDNTLDDFNVAYDKQEDCTEDDYLEMYLEALKIGGRSYKTIQRYKYIITKLLRRQNVMTKKINTYHIRNYLAAEDARGISQRTINGERQIFNGYFGWLQREGLIGRNPVCNILPPKIPKRIKHIYSDVDIEKLKQQCDSIRDKAIICFLGSSGCRVSEVSGLDISKVDLRNGECLIHGKGDKERTVYIDGVTCMMIDEYLKTRNDHNPALFVGKGCRRLNPGGIRAMLHRIGQKAGVTDVYPHKFRRTFATNMSRRGARVEQIAAILGHERLDTTMKYVVLDKSEVKHTYERCAS